jgi:hypothetical protein
MSARFIFFDSTEGGEIAVNAENVTHVPARVNGNGMLSRFLARTVSAFPGRVWMPPRVCKGIF